MEWMGVAETAARWGVSERSVRNYCAQGRVSGAYLAGKTWRIPKDAAKPQREWLRDTCLTAQDAMREVLERLRVDATAS